MLLPLLLSLLWGGEWAQDPAFQLEVPELVTVQEGLCVLVPCTVTYPKIEWDDSTSAYGYWFRKGTKKTTADPVATNEPNTKVQMSTQDRFQLVGNPHNYSCSLVIRDARKEDMAAYYFRVERGPYVKYNFNSFFLNVTVLSITPSPQDHDTNLTCQVDFSRKGVSTHRTVQLSIAYAPKDLVLSVSRDNTSDLPENLKVMVSQANRTVLANLSNGTSLPVLEGQSLRLVCVTCSNPPARLSWAWRRQTLSPTQPSDPGVLELPRIQMEHEGEFTCQAQNPLGSQHISLSLSVHYKKGSISTAFSKGVFLGTGITTLLSLCLILITVNTLRKKWTQAETLRPRVSRSSTILDYINVIPNTGPLARNRRAKPSSPSQSPSPGVHPPEPKKNQKELRFASPSGPRPKSSTQDPEYENSQEELHYATLKFLDLRPRLEDTQADYEEIEFH
ncbi:sialic acid-binding Ig-like lectin 10 isoform X4 [Cynocephalus volans]|uniref:sialic acid-binding Ig-like lectin 10 isoform X4 n=1 Tax=Cynocephalus volans TaxID=110931 RepID=UPI002FCB2636